MTKNELLYLLNYILIGLIERKDDGSEDTKLINELQITLFAFKDYLISEYNNMTIEQKKTHLMNLLNKIDNCKELQDILKNLNTESERN